MINIHLKMSWIINLHIKIDSKMDNTSKTPKLKIEDKQTNK